MFKVGTESLCVLNLIDKSNTFVILKTKNMTAEQTKQSSVGEWVSIAPELRPSITKNPDGSMKPFYLTRVFRYSQGDKFELEMLNSADAYGKVPLVKIVLKGHMVWQGEHPIAAGAQKVDFIADGAYEVTPLHQGFADVMNQAASKGFNKWEVNITQSILSKAFTPFGLAEGQIYGEFDLIYILNDMMFWGAKHVDGRSFDKLENRPTNLQIPMVRKK
jgi:hypothetical protein